MTTRFKIGDVVCMKSNTDVPMTICLKFEWEGYQCMWFDNDGHLQRAEFPSDALELVV